MRGSTGRTSITTISPVFRINSCGGNPEHSTLINSPNWGLCPTSIKVLYVGRVSREKGVLALPAGPDRYQADYIIFVTGYGYRYRMGLAMPGCRPDAPVGTDPGPGRTGTSYSGP